MLELDNVSAQYDTTDGKVYAVDGVTLTVRDDEIVGIAGESGCGKSTLLKLIYDFVSFPLEITSGEVRIRTEKDGQERVWSSGQISKEWWKVISYVPQGAMHVMNPVVKVRKQFFDTIGKGLKKSQRKELEKDLEAYLAQLDLSPEVLDAYPHQLSGGMRQRVLIALASFTSPNIILADEPTTALDVVVQRGILMMLKRVQRKEKNSIILVSHDMGVHYQITHKMALMYAGQIVESGPTQEIFEFPRHPYTQMLIAALPRVGDDSQKEGIPGTPPNLRNPPKGCRFAARCPFVMDICRVEDPPRTEVGPDHFASCHLLTEEPA